MVRTDTNDENMNRSWQSAAATAARTAPFLCRLLAELPKLTDELEQSGASVAFAKRLDRLKRARNKLVDKPNIAKVLRRTRSEVALLVALADISGHWSVMDAAAALSRFAESAIDLALRAAIAPLLARNAFNVGTYEECGLACLALGKLGAGELNYSSDVDLIFLFDEVVLTTASGDDPLDLLLRVVRDFTDLLQTRDEDGYVLRVDLRLRPDPNSTPAVLSMAAADIYYQSAALTWERAAFTRARAVAGDIKAGDAFLQRLSRWIWRRSLDFTAIRDIHELRLHMANHFGQQEWQSAGYDLKRGSGGIREIEFVLQMHQLIHGGRLPALRGNNTVSGLQAIADAGLLSTKDVASLQGSYFWLRCTEHRLQMLEDTQTHAVPDDSDQRHALALLCGYRSVAAFNKQLKTQCAQVHRIYTRLTKVDSRVDSGLPRDDKSLTQWLCALGFGAQAMPMVQLWRTDRFRAMRTVRAQDAMESLLPDFLTVLAKSPEPNILLARVNDLLERLPSGVQFLELLDTNRKLLDLLGRVLLHSPILASRLAQHPDLLDVVFDTSFFVPPATCLQMRSELETVLGAARDEGQIDKVARWQAEKQFQIAVLLIDGLMDGRAAARAYAWIMDAIVAIVADIATYNFERSHGKVDGGSLIILALGGWGGEAMMSQSDLDLVCLYTGSHDSGSTASQSLSAAHYFNRLAQRVIGYLTAQTAYGPMADIDTRLRPSGHQGLLCVTVDSFIQYQREQAWTWEHLALTRVRCVVGPGRDAIAKAAVVLQSPRNTQKITQDVTQMRQDIADHKPPKGALDFKLMPGGLIDIEFITQFCQLLSANGHPGVILPTIEMALQALGKAGTISSDDAYALIAIYQRMIGARLLLGLCAEGDATCEPLPKVQQPLFARAYGGSKYHQALAQAKKDAQKVNNIWHRVFQENEAMTVEVGKKAPAFKLPGDDGHTHSLSGYKGQNIVLYFYPKDDTSGCTKQAIEFTALTAKFSKANTVVIGVSRDSVESHIKFRTKHNLKITLGADTNGKVTEDYGVWVEKSMYGRKYMGIERTTVLIDATGKVVDVWSKVKVPGHADAVLKTAQALG
jgi:[glutamine synthetase] adenylyltransferase / [glutamine synthetase]-adenylyl-L-tyrosine phosphorylase